jgi:predicted MFS family arabinose efflux permease
MKIGVLKSNIEKMYVFKFLMAMHFMGGVLIPFFLDWGGLSFARVMVLQSIFMISIFAFEVPSGAFADRFGRKNSVMLSALTLCVAVLLYSWIPNFYVFVVAEFFWASSFALASGADESLVFESLDKKNRKKSKGVFGRFKSAEMISFALSAPIGSFLSQFMDLNYVMALTFFPGMLAFLLATTFEEPGVKERSPERDYWVTLASGVNYFKDHPLLKTLAFDRVSISTLAVFVIWSHQLLLEELGVAVVYFGVVICLMTLAEAFFMLNFERLEKIMGSKKNYLLASAVIPGLGFICLGFVDSAWIAIPLFIIVGGIGLSRGVLFSTYLNNQIKVSNRATVLSTVSMIEQLIMGLVYLAFGVLVSWSLQYSMMVIGVLMVLFALASRVEEEMLVG